MGGSGLALQGGHMFYKTWSHVLQMFCLSKVDQLELNPFPNKAWFLAPLAEGQRAIVMAW